MKKLWTFVIAFALLLCSGITVFAADGNVTYSGNAGTVIFEPGSDHSLTDLFPNFKDVMPGDTLTQKITVKNDANNQVKVKIYLRSAGAQAGSEDFLSQLNLLVTKSDDNEMAYMFDATANQTAQLTDWVYLGTLYSGGTVDLDVALAVPAELSNEYQNRIGYLDWEFRIEEYPTEPEDPEPPKTGDDSHLGLWFGAMIGSLAMIVILLVWHKKNRQKEENTVNH